jgi:hypothetical protein
LPTNIIRTSQQYESESSIFGDDSMASDTLVGKIMKISGNNLTIMVFVESGEKTESYEVTLPVKAELLDIAVSNIGRNVSFNTWKGYVDQLKPAF